MFFFQCFSSAHEKSTASARYYDVISNSNHDDDQCESLYAMVRLVSMKIFSSSIDFLFQRLIQNLVFYGISQNTGSFFLSTRFSYFSNEFVCLGAWPLNPYVSFAVSATVELAAYIFVHLILDRVGRKGPYCFFAILFGVTAFSVLPVQNYMTKNSQGEFRSFSMRKSSTFLLVCLFCSAQKMILNIINGILKFCASASYAIIYIYANELFPTNVRNTGMGICSMVARIGAIIGTFCNDSLVK